MKVVDLGLERTRYAVIDETIESRWRRVTSMQHDTVAVVTPRDRITFAELELRTDALVRELRLRGSHGARPVAVDLEPTAESVPAILATLISGRPLVMIDPQLPEARRAHIMSASGAVALQSILDESAATGFRFDNALEPSSSDPAMIAFTSGTSGAPKGVVLSHSMCLNKADELAAAIDLHPDDHIGNLLPVSFGAGITALIMGLMNGVTVYCWDPRIDGVSGIDDWLIENSITTAHCAPSFLRAWSSLESDEAQDNSLGSLRVVVTYGEAVHGEDYARHRSHGFARVTYVNWLATTETGVVAYNAFPPHSELPVGVVPAGRARDGKDVQIVDVNGVPLPDGEIGEIQVVSSDLADGYHGDPDRTAARFTRLGDGVSIYRTGDRGRIDERGELQLRGRVDDAVKIRGYLVEPMEVEAHIRRIPGVADVFVAVVLENDRPEIVAYVVLTKAVMARSGAEMRRELAKFLPTWMLPRHFVLLAELPRNERGKVDRPTLPTVAVRSDLPTLAGPTELMLAGIWKSILCTDSVDREDDFFELGGDSLASIEVLSRIQEKFRVRISSAQFVSASTIKDLAGFIDRSAVVKQSAPQPTVVPLKSDGSGTPLFIVNGAGAPPTALSNLSNSLTTDRPVFAAQARGFESRGLPDRSVKGAARRLIVEIKKIQPTGPYLLAGYSYGGYVALEIAAQLEQAGDDIQRVIVLDSRIPSTVVQRLAARAGVPLDASVIELAPQPQSNVRWQPTKPAVAALWVRSLFAGIMQYPPAMQWIIFLYIANQAIARHRIRPCAAPVTVIRGAYNNRGSEVWSLIATGSLEFDDIDAGHEDLIRPPYVRQTASAFDRICDRT
ncbi:alpha/beta fold hydrolase [Rhodococcus erythropolis]|uniref:alpha/beta fold hydrolase n=1 Tax=Rhodococcus erythropolis TaxID=1833 RepID=UPI0024B6E18B|nr:alpha/beta fold hydrolase [Rhodococcus erythropolis]MDJ0014665.1 AMP-binding protein [Rhodococcus erythropolis]